MNKKRTLISRIKLYFMIIAKTFKAFKDQGLGSLSPLVIILFLLGIFFICLNTFTPLAPFVYSLI